MTPSTTPAADLEGQSAFMRLLGVHLDQTRGDRVAGWFEVGADHHQPWGLVHGGVFTGHRDLRHRRGRHSLRGLPDEAWLRQALDNAWSLP